MKEEKKQLEDLMNEQYEDWKDKVGIGGLGGIIGSVKGLLKLGTIGVGMLAGSFVSLRAWLRKLQKFSDEVWEPARLAAIAKCRKETGFQGKI